MHNEILISNLRFCLVNNDCFEYVIKIMDEYNTTLELVGQLKDINNMIYLIIIKIIIKMMIYIQKSKRK